MFGVGDKVRWGSDLGTVVDSGLRTVEVEFDNGTTFEFNIHTGKLDDGFTGVGDALVLVSKAAASKKTIKVYRWEKVSKTSTGRPFIKQTEGLYDEEHARQVLPGFVKIEATERLVEVAG